MKIQGIDSLEFLDRSFRWNNRDYVYDQVTAVSFTATVTSHRVNGIPTGKSYSAQLSFNSGSQWINIEPTKGWFGKLTSEGMEALQKANSILGQLTFTSRVSTYETQFERAGFFDFGGIQFRKDKHVFKSGKEVGIIFEDLTPKLGPFQLTLEQKLTGFGQRLASIFASKDITVDLTTNRDCLLYMLNHVHRISWPKEFIPEKRVDREKLFYETVVRFGAMLAKVDGNADSSELMQLKRFFSLDDTKLLGAARVFNEALEASLTIESVLGPFADEFEDSAELKESFLVGMLSVALADGVFDPREFALIQQAIHRLSLSQSAFERILAAAGLSDRDGQGSSSSGFDPLKSKPSNSHRVMKLRILGLEDGADRAAISTAYRLLVRRYHPDVLRGQGMPQDEISKAESILVQVNLAYEVLMRDAA
jgi:DnaJ like chaperone protein